MFDDVFFSFPNLHETLRFPMYAALGRICLNERIVPNLRDLPKVAGQQLDRGLDPPQVWTHVAELVCDFRTCWWKWP